MPSGRAAGAAAAPVEPDQVVGADVGPNPVVESLPFGPGGDDHACEEPRAVDAHRSRCRSRWSCCCSWCCRSAAGAVVATVTARRLAEPLRDVADRAARLGAGDFRSAPDRHGIPELDRVSDVLDTSAVGARGAGAARARARRRRLAPAAQPAHRAAAAARRAGHPPRPERAPRGARRAGAGRAALRGARRAAGGRPGGAGRRRRAAGPAGGAAAPWPRSGGPTLRAAGRSLKVRVPDGLLARVTPARIREAVGALRRERAAARRRHGHAQRPRAAENSLLVEVTDAGAGVPEELVPHVFDRGVSVGSSTGLGLALARALVEADGGRLELSRARPPVFTIFLPAARADDVVGATAAPGRRRRAEPTGLPELPVQGRDAGGGRPGPGTRSGGRPTSGTPCRRARR